MGAAYTYLLAEPPPETGTGNFTWSAQITVFVLFVASTAFLLDRARDHSRRPPGWRYCPSASACTSCAG